MNEITIKQFYSFLIFIGIGILIVLIFDIFRIFRKSFKTPDIITLIEDIIFGLLVTFILLFSIFKFNDGELRLYIFLGILLGGIIYILTISKYFINISVLIINVAKKIFRYLLKTISFPFKIILKLSRKMFLKPISFFFINFRKKFTNINKKFTLLQEKRR